MIKQYSSDNFARSTLADILRLEDISEQNAYQLIEAIMQGNVDPILTSAILIAMRMKGEHEHELLGAVRAMRQLATKLPLPLDKQPVIDLVGTGGDGANLFNVSTAASFVVAACGGSVAKHCGRGVSSTSGGADLLAEIGVNTNPAIDFQQQLFLQHNLVFMLAPNHHPAMRFVSPIRQTLKQSTFFNILGPLANPAEVHHYLLGVFTTKLASMMASLLQKLGAQRALVVHSEDGLDEISIAAPTHLHELDTNGVIHHYVIDPYAIGMQGTLDNCRVENVQQSRAIIQAAFCGQHPDAAKQIAVNAGAALFVLQKAASIAEGAAIALEAINNNSANTLLQTYVHASQKR